MLFNIKSNKNTNYFMLLLLEIFQCHFR